MRQPKGKRLPWQPDPNRNHLRQLLKKKNQHYNYQSRYIACDFRNPDFELLARSFGVGYHRVASTDEIPTVLDRIDKGGVLLVDVILNPDAFPDYSSGR